MGIHRRTPTTSILGETSCVKIANLTWNGSTASKAGTAQNYFKTLGTIFLFDVKYFADHTRRMKAIKPWKGLKRNKAAERK